MKVRFSVLVAIFLLVTVPAIIHPLKRDAEMSPKASGGRQMPSYIRKPSLQGRLATSPAHCKTSSLSSTVTVNNIITIFTSTEAIKHHHHHYHHHTWLIDDIHFSALQLNFKLRHFPVRELARSDRSETQSFSIGWSNILPVI